VGVDCPYYDWNNKNEADFKMTEIFQNDAGDITGIRGPWHEAYTKVEKFSYEMDEPRVGAPHKKTNEICVKKVEDFLLFVRDPDCAAENLMTKKQYTKKFMETVNS